MTAKVRAEVVRAIGNSADFLRDALLKLREAHKANLKQRNALCSVFGLRDTADNVTFYNMLAEFNGLPGVVRDNLSQSTDASRFFEWVGPIESGAALLRRAFPPLFMGVCAHGRSLLGAPYGGTAFAPACFRAARAASPA